MYDPNPDDALRLRILRAAAACRVRAIVLDQLDKQEDGAGVVNRATADSPLQTHGRIVIVDASLAGFRGAEALRAEGFSGYLS